MENGVRKMEIWRSVCKFKAFYTRVFESFSAKLLNFKAKFSHKQRFLVS